MNLIHNSEGCYILDYNVYNISLIKGSVKDDEGKPIPTYGIYYTANGRTYTVRDLSTKRCEVELFINNLISGGVYLSLMDDLIEDFVS